jgi:hypothetical protein
LLALFATVTVQACSSTSKSDDDAGKDVESSVEVGDTAWDVASHECPASIAANEACNVDPNVACSIPQSICPPAGCYGSFSASCQCRAGHWICAFWECFAPCQGETDAAGD